MDGLETGIVPGPIPEASGGSECPQFIPMDDSLLLHDASTDHRERSRPMPPGYVHEPLLGCELGN